jgi:Tol biopolymer transport system component
VRAFLSTASAAFAASAAGTIVYQPNGDLSRLKWVDRGGREAGDVSPPGTYLDVRVGPDGRSATFSRMRAVGTYDVWSIDLARGTEQRLTQEDRDTEMGPVPVPGGPTLYYAWSHGTAPRVARRNLDTGKAEILFPGLTLQVVTDIAPDGGALIFQDRPNQGPYNLFLLPLTGDPKPIPFRTSSANETDARFSPDGRFVSFTATEGGVPEVCVAPVAGGAKTVVSSGGGRFPRWSRDGRELIYVSVDQRVVAVPVRTSPTLSLGTPSVLFALGGREWAYFDTAPDGRFLAIVLEQPANEQPLTAILNWSMSSPRK